MADTDPPLVRPGDLIRVAFNTEAQMITPAKNLLIRPGSGPGSYGVWLNRIELPDLQVTLVRPRECQLHGVIRTDQFKYMPPGSVVSKNGTKDDPVQLNTNGLGTHQSHGAWRIVAESEADAEWTILRMGW